MSDGELQLFGTQEGCGLHFNSVRDVVGWRERVNTETVWLSTAAQHAPPPAPANEAAARSSPVP
jgi:hypothetical protein